MTTESEEELRARIKTLERELERWKLRHGASEISLLKTQRDSFAVDAHRLDYLLRGAEFVDGKRPSLVFGFELPNRTGLTDKRTVIDYAMGRTPDTASSHV